MPRLYINIHHPRFFSLPLHTSHFYPYRNSIIPTMSFSFSSSSSPSPSIAEDGTQNSKLTQVLKYHNQTKHNFNKYARGPHGLDWANQPNPFRRYNSAPLLPLLIEEDVNSPFYPSLFSSLPPPKPIDKSSISHFFHDSLALSAWKSTGFSTWSLRVNPSSGNLHPTEAYIISPPIESVNDSSFVAHYAPKEHALERRTVIPKEFDFFDRLLPPNSFLIGLSSIFWREAWKYGERGFRYCNHDVGHAIAAVTMAAAGLGWDVKILDGLGFKDLEKLMGLENLREFEIPEKPVKGVMPDIEFEHPDCVMVVFPNGVGRFEVNYQQLSAAIDGFSRLEWIGKLNLLSKEHLCWDVIYKTAEAVKKPLTVAEGYNVNPFQSGRVPNEGCYKNFTLQELVRKRRSAVDMDGVTVMERDTFYQIMSHCLPSGSLPSGWKQKRPLALPYRVLDWYAEVHAALFVHRVEGLHKGLYFLVRNEDHLEDLKKSTRTEFLWVKPEGCPDGLPLYELARGDCRQLSKQLSCHQDIASDGCFSLGMVAHFEPTLREKVWMYPRLFWETGVLGQVLYLEAHAAGISATGIGCFFDDPVHEVLGLSGSNYQSLYHFTVGGPVEDKRIMSLPAYPGPAADA